MNDPQQPAPDFDPWAPAPATRRSRRAARVEAPIATPTQAPLAAPSVAATQAAAPVNAPRIREPREPQPAREPLLPREPILPREPMRLPNPSAPAFGADQPGGLGRMLDGDKHRLAKVTASGAGGLGLLLGSVFGSRRNPERMATAASGAQAPVGTGRRIAVLSSSGGAGKSTAAALLGRIYAGVRTDTIAVLDLDPGAGSLGLRLGTEHAAPIDELAAATTGTLPEAHELAGMLGHASANLFATGPRGSLRGAAPDARALREGTAALSRYFPITLLDCPTSYTDPVTRAVLTDCHGALFVLPATLPGMENALAALQGWFADRHLSTLPLTLLVIQQDRGSALGATALAGRLSSLGLHAHAIGYDRHLAAGARISLPRISAAHRLAATELAADLLAAANTVR